MNLHKLKTKIFEKQKTYKDCAEALNISIATFNNKMNGHSKFNVPEVKALADFLGMTSAELLSILS